MIYVVEFQAYLSYDYKRECTGTVIIEAGDLTDDDIKILINKEFFEQDNDYVCNTIKVLYTKPTVITPRVIHIDYDKQE